MSGQLPLFVDFEPNGNGHRMNREQAGLLQTPAGAERLLGELIKRGLHRDHLEAAARLALLLDDERANHTAANGGRREEA